jgi:hypothetical protein
VTRGSPAIPDLPHAPVNRFPMRQCHLVRPCATLLFHSLSDDFDDDTFAALAIEFALEEALPWGKIDPAIGDRQDDLVMQQEVFEVGIAVILTCLVMAIAGMYGCELLCPCHEVAVKAGFLVLDDNRCGEVHGRYQGQTFLDAAFTNDAFDIVGDGDDLFARFGVEGEVGGLGCA